MLGSRQAGAGKTCGAGRYWQGNAAALWAGASQNPLQAFLEPPFKVPPSSGSGTRWHNRAGSQKIVKFYARLQVFIVSPALIWGKTRGTHTAEDIKRYKWSGFILKLLFLY